MKSFFPKLWGGPNAVGEGKLRALEMTDAPYQTSSGPGFIARKKGMFREVESLPGDDVRLKFRISDVDPATAGYYSPTGVYTAVPHARPSVMLKLRKKDGKTDVVGAQRSDTPYMRTINWVSADKKTVVSWRARGRYGSPTRPQYGADNSVAENGLPGAFSSWYSYGLLTQSYATPYGSAIWVNGRKYVTPYLVVGACVVRLAGTDGVVKDFLKMVAWDFWQPFGAATLGPRRYIVCPLELAGQTSGTDYSAYDIRPGLQALGASGDDYDGPFLFDSFGTAAVCTGTDRLSPVLMSCPGRGAPAFSSTRNLVTGVPSGTTTSTSGTAESGTTTLTQTLGYSVGAADFAAGASAPTLYVVSTERTQESFVLHKLTNDSPGPGAPIEGTKIEETSWTNKSNSDKYLVGGQEVLLLTSTEQRTRSLLALSGTFGEGVTLSESASAEGSLNAALWPLDLRVGVYRVTYPVSQGPVSASETATFPNLSVTPERIVFLPAPPVVDKAELRHGTAVIADIPGALGVQGTNVFAEAAADPTDPSRLLCVVGRQYTPDLTTAELRSKCFFYSPQDGSTTLLADSEVAGPNQRGGVPDDGKRHAYLHICYAHNSKDGA